MSADNRLFLDGKAFKDEGGLSALLKLKITSEKEVDEALWFDPEHASEPLLDVIRQYKGEMSPTLSRLALKALALPLFMREFQGENVAEEVAAEVSTISRRTGILLDAYMDHVNNGNDDQTVVTQALADTTVFGLNARSFRSTQQDDIVLLPVSPESYYKTNRTNFTVLRRRSLGRAHLVIADQLDSLYRQDPQVNQHRILISPQEMTGPDATIDDLAEALISDSIQQTTAEEADFISAASARLYTRIHGHFDQLTSKKT